MTPADASPAPAAGTPTMQQQDLGKTKSIWPRLRRMRRGGWSLRWRQQGRTLIVCAPTLVQVLLMLASHLTPRAIRARASELRRLRAVELCGGPFDGVILDRSTLATFGQPVKYIVPIDDAESAVYTRRMGGGLTYLYTVSDG